jgi:hypothetical protein
VPLVTANVKRYEPASSTFSRKSLKNTSRDNEKKIKDTMKTFTQFFIIIILFFSSFIHLGCPKDDGVTPPNNPLQITVEDVSCIEATLKISLASSEQNKNVVVKRNDSTIFAITLITQDSVVTDTNLSPQKTYTYTASAGSWKATTQTTTQDTTSHQIQWQLPDTLGAQGLIRDVWVFSRDNAWAVGEIYLRDSTGKVDMGNPYNAAHWDGSKWQLVKIPFIGSCSAVINPPLMAIWAFSETNILVTNGGSIVRFDGTNATMDCRMNSLLTGAINKIFAISPDNIFAVGNSGTIVHYSNGTWTKQESHTTVNLQDVWGIDNEHVWATGFNSNDGHCVLLQYDGKVWKTIYDNTNATPSTLQYFNTVWTDNVNYLYLDGGSYTQLLNLRTGSFRRTDKLSTYTMFRLRGIKRNDIFRVGFGGETVHFNGVSWYLYPDLKLLNEGFAGFNSVHPIKDFVLIGGLYLTTLNGFPVVLRGYR